MKILEFLFNRVVLLIIGAILEIAFITFSFLYFRSTFAWLEQLLKIISALVVMFVVNRSRHLSYDLKWVLLIILLPVTGVFIYLFLGANIIVSPTVRRIVSATNEAKKYYEQDPSVQDELKTTNAAGQFTYLSNHAGFPAYRNAEISYYKSGEEGFPRMLEELANAREFIFLEYFIIQEGKMWNSILEILKQKAKEGLDIRVMYDDLGCFTILPSGYQKQLESWGIQCVEFNKIYPIIGAVGNHRDHRKILVIDGVTAFSGGVNLADEYINKIERFGYWKDNMICINGEAVWSYTIMFLTNWNAFKPTDQDFKKYYRQSTVQNTRGYIVPYGDTPLDYEQIGQNVYLNILSQAKDYVYIYTPYLIIDTDFQNTLILAAQRGVDVRIITPGIPDKKIVWDLTRSFYNDLIQGGVKIYEYTPGFDHSKVFVCDDQIATVGTINLDYRSLYLHFENGTYLYQVDEINKVKDDLLEAFDVSHQIALNEVNYGLIRTFFIGIVKLFASEM